MRNISQWTKRGQKQMFIYLCTLDWTAFKIYFIKFDIISAISLMRSNWFLYFSLRSIRKRFAEALRMRNWQSKCLLICGMSFGEQLSHIRKCFDESELIACKMSVDFNLTILQTFLILLWYNVPFKDLFYSFTHHSEIQILNFLIFSHFFPGYIFSIRPQAF